MVKWKSGERKNAIPNHREHYPNTKEIFMENSNKLLSVKVDYGMFKQLDALLDTVTMKCLITQTTLNKLLEWTKQDGSRSLRSKSLKDFAGERFTSPHSVVAKDVLGRENRFKAIYLEYGSVVVAWAAVKKKNDNAINLLVVSFADSFRSLAFEQAGIKIDAEERNQKIKDHLEWLEKRQLNKDSFWTITGAIKNWMIKHGVEFDAVHNNPYRDAMRAINMAVLGKNASDIREELNLPKKADLVRDYYNQNVLDTMKQLQNVAGKHIKNRDMEPLEAIQTVVEFLYIEPIHPYLKDDVAMNIAQEEYPKAA